jgi:hypothetical protein
MGKKKWVITNLSRMKPHEETDPSSLQVCLYILYVEFMVYSVILFKGFIYLFFGLT